MPQRRAARLVFLITPTAAAKIPRGIAARDRDRTQLSARSAEEGGMSENAHRALGLVLLVAAVVLLGKAAWPGARLGPSRQSTSCARPVERAGVGVACQGAGDDLAPGTRLEADGRRGRMSPRRLELFDVPIDIAHAPAEELASLPGVGAGLAARIVDARTARPFASVEDLAEVKGIGRRRMWSIRKRLYVTDVEP